MAAHAGVRTPGDASEEMASANDLDLIIFERMGHVKDSVLQVETEFSCSCVALDQWIDVLFLELK